MAKFTSRQQIKKLSLQQGEICAQHDKLRFSQSLRTRRITNLVPSAQAQYDKCAICTNFFDNASAKRQKQRTLELNAVQCIWGAIPNNSNATIEEQNKGNDMCVCAHAHERKRIQGLQYVHTCTYHNRVRFQANIRCNNSVLNHHYRQFIFLFFISLWSKWK